MKELSFGSVKAGALKVYDRVGEWMEWAFIGPHEIEERVPRHIRTLDRMARRMEEVLERGKEKANIVKRPDGSEGVIVISLGRRQYTIDPDTERQHLANMLEKAKGMRKNGVGRRDVMQFRQGLLSMG